MATLQARNPLAKADLSANRYGPSRSCTAEHRPGASKSLGDLTAPNRVGDGGRMVEGRNATSTHVLFRDTLRTAQFQERSVGWRNTIKLGKKTTEVDWTDGLKHQTCFGQSDVEFQNALRPPLICEGPKHWRQQRHELNSLSRSSLGRDAMSSSAPAGFFPSGTAGTSTGTTSNSFFRNGAREELRRRLVAKFGSVLGGFRALDPLDQGKLSFNDFCRSIRRLGIHQDVRGLWEALDKRELGFVGVQDLDPELSWLLQEFQHFLFEKCGSAEAAWSLHFCPTFGHGGKSRGRCPAKTFAQAALKLGFEESTEAVFAALNVDKVPGGVAEKEFCLLDKWFNQKSHLSSNFGNVGRPGHGRSNAGAARFPPGRFSRGELPAASMTW